MTSPRKLPKAKPRTGWWIAGLALAVVALSGAIAITTSNGGTAKGIEQVREVTVTGPALPVLPDAGVDPAIGQLAPSLAGQSFDGTPVLVKPGEATLLIFLAHWCPHCQREVPLLVDWAGAGGVPTGVRVVGVATATTSDRPNFPPSQWLDNELFPWPVIADSEDGDAAMAMGLPGFPYFVLVDADGRVLFRRSGEVNPAELASQIDKALSGTR